MNLYEKKILTEEIIFNYVKEIPYELTFENSNIKDEKVISICSNVTTSIAAHFRDTLEFQKVATALIPKRNRATCVADYRFTLYKNILYPLFNYVNLLDSLDLLLSNEYDSRNVNIEKLWLLITEKNNLLINRQLDNVINSNINVSDLFEKYKGKDISDLEYDYTVAIVLCESINAVLNTFLNESNQNLFNELKKHDAKNVKYLLNNYIAIFTNQMYKQTLNNI